MGFIFTIRADQETSDLFMLLCYLLLNEFEEIFNEPRLLPSTRTHVHHIALSLLPYLKQVKIQGYKYQRIQKNVNEKMVAEMLDQGIIKTF